MGGGDRRGSDFGAQTYYLARFLLKTAWKMKEIGLGGVFILVGDPEICGYLFVSCIVLYLHGLHQYNILPPTEAVLLKQIKSFRHNY